MSIMSDIMPTPRSVIAARSGAAIPTPRVEQANPSSFPPSSFKEEAARAQQALSVERTTGGQTPTPPTQNAAPTSTEAARTEIAGTEAANIQPGIQADAQPDAQPSWYGQHSGSGEADAHGYQTPNGEVGTFGLMDAIDVVNPLHHIPVIGGLYRELTGDQISPTARVAGGMLWGGPMGVLAAAINSGVEAETGKDIPTNVVAMLSGDQTLPDPNAPANTLLAAQTVPSPEPEANPTGTDPKAASTNTDDGTLVFNGASASRLDAFIRTSGGRQNASPAAADAWAIRESLKLDANRPAPNPSLYPGVPAAGGGDDRIMVSGPAKSPGSVGDWMSQALDRYEVLRARKPS